MPKAEPVRAFRKAMAAAVSAAGWPRSVESIFLKSARSEAKSPSSAWRCRIAACSAVMPRLSAS